jgi:hypothetical protein
VVRHRCRQTACGARACRISGSGTSANVDPAAFCVRGAGSDERRRGRGLGDEAEESGGGIGVTGRGERVAQSSGWARDGSRTYGVRALVGYVAG